HGEATDGESLVQGGGVDNKPHAGFPDPHRLHDLWWRLIVAQLVDEPAGPCEAPASLGALEDRAADRRLIGTEIPIVSPADGGQQKIALMTGRGDELVREARYPHQRGLVVLICVLTMQDDLVKIHQPSRGFARRVVIAVDG